MKQKNKNVSIIIFSVFIIGVVSAIIFWQTSKDIPNSADLDTVAIQDENSERSKSMAAWTEMQRCVSERIKSAEILNFESDGHNKVRAIGNDRYLVHSYVDTKNSQGEVKRTDFNVMIKKKADKWVLEQMRFH